MLVLLKTTCIFITGSNLQNVINMTLGRPVPYLVSPTSFEPLIEKHDYIVLDGDQW